MSWLGAAKRFSPGLPHYLFAGVFLLRLVALERLSRSGLLLPDRGDMHFYSEWAKRILGGQFDLHAAFYGLPLYAYFLALLYRVFGSSPFVPALLQVLMDSGTAVLIYLLTLELFRRASFSPSSTSSSGVAPLAPRIFAVGAAVAWAFFVPAQAYSIILMPTAWLIFVFWFVVWRITARQTPAGWVEMAMLGLLIGFTAMAIATVLFLVPLVIAAAIVRPSLSLNRAILAKVIIFLAGVGVGTSPCWVHNYLIARDPVLLSAHGGVNFWIGNNPTSNGYPKFPPGLRAGQAAMLEDSVTSAETALGRPLKRAEVSAYWSAKANDYIANHKMEWVRLLAVKARNFWNAFQYDDLSIITNLREQKVIFPGLYFGLLAAFAIPGLVFAWRYAAVARWIVAAIALHMIALMTVFITERYRLPVVPGLIVLATFGLAMLRQALLLRHNSRALAYIALLIGTTLFVSWPQRDPALWALDAYNSGWQALECGDLPLAETKLTLARRYVPTNPETNFALGNLRLVQENQPAAVAFYLTTLQYDSAHRGAMNNLAFIALEQNRYDVAETWLRQAERIDPRNAKTHFLLAKSLLGEGNRDAASAEIETALQLRPDQREFTDLKEKIATRR